MEGLFIYYAQKNIRQMNYHYYCILLYSEHRNHTEWLCGITPTAYRYLIASTLYHECTQSHQLHTMTLNSPINTVPWMNAVTSTPYHEWKWSHQLRTTNICNLSTPSSHFHFQFNQGFFGSIAYIHGTVRSWCDRVHSWYEVEAIW